MDILKIQNKLNELELEKKQLIAKIEILQNYLATVNDVPFEVQEIVNGGIVEGKGRTWSSAGKKAYSWEIVDYIKKNSPISRADLIEHFSHTSVSSHLTVIKKEGFVAERKGVFTFIKDYPEGYDRISRNKGGYTISEKIQFIFVDCDEWLTAPEVRDRIKQAFSGHNEKIQSVSRVLHRLYNRKYLQRENGKFALIGVNPCEK